MKKQLVAFLKRRGFERGVIGTNRQWFAVWTAISLASFLRKRINKPLKVERYVLKPGQTLEIRDTGVAWELTEGPKA